MPFNEAGVEQAKGTGTSPGKVIAEQRAKEQGKSFEAPRKLGILSNLVAKLTLHYNTLAIRRQLLLTFTIFAFPLDLETLRQSARRILRKRFRRLH